MKQQKHRDEQEDIKMAEVKIINDYSNTEELLQKFKVVNPTPVESQMEKNIQNRLLTGFANWNEGYEAWEEWGNILYTEDSLYNLYGVHMTLREYQASQKVGLARTDIQLGQFHNMLVCGDWTAICYDVDNTSRQTGEKDHSVVMEFVHFGDLGEELGTRVIEGWASTRGVHTNGIMYFVSDEGKKAVLDHFAEIEKYEIPEADDLTMKYPVLHPTPANSDMEDAIRSFLYSEFDAWNDGEETYRNHVEENYADNFTYQHRASNPVSLDAYKEIAAEKQKITERLFFNNMLISGDWAAIYYPITRVNAEGKKEAADVMQFIHFTETEDGIKADYTRVLS